jgi:hypothetical protein
MLKLTTNEETVSAIMYNNNHNLMHYATRRMVADSRPNDVNELFQFTYSSGRSRPWGLLSL